MIQIKKAGKITDFELPVTSGKDIRILQLTDPQITHLESTRTEIRHSQIGCAFFSGINDIHDDNIRTYRYMDDVVSRTKPHLIVVTGDLIYGETDDNGGILCEFIGHMDSYKIPWAVVFGNHDNESAVGVHRQCEMLQASPYCLFTPGNVTGNSNYSIALTENGNAKYILMLLDTNGCHVYTDPAVDGEGLRHDNIDYDMIEQHEGIYDDQIKWYSDTLTAIASENGKVVPSLAFFHVPPYISTVTFEERYKKTKISPPLYGKGDFGQINEMDGGGSIGEVDRDFKFFNTAKALGTSGMFFGHLHINSLSILCDGVRCTYGLKTGTHNDYAPDMLGGTLITISENECFPKVEHIYCTF